jgi:hypothetical protein
MFLPFEAERTNQTAKGGVLREAKDDVPCKVKPFLRTKRTAGIGKQSLVNYNWGCAYGNGIVVWLLKALTCSDEGLLLPVGG